MGLAAGFEYGIAIHDIEFGEVAAGRKHWAQAKTELGGLWRKIRGQVLKDYVGFPLLSGLAAPTTLLGNLTGTVTRNVWSAAVIFCGHFPFGAETLTEDQLDGETRAQWYLRQMLGSANLDGSGRSAKDHCWAMIDVLRVLTAGAQAAEWTTASLTLRPVPKLPLVGCRLQSAGRFGPRQHPGGHGDVLVMGSRGVGDTGGGAWARGSIEQEQPQ